MGAETSILKYYIFIYLLPLLQYKIKKIVFIYLLLILNWETQSKLLKVVYPVWRSLTTKRSSNYCKQIVVCITKHHSSL